MNIEQAKQLVEADFPFPQYMSDLDESYKNIAATAAKYLKPGASVLDFGSGPCDKTAILQRMGYQCSAYDDLSDHWHQVPGNREKIMDFASQAGINFHVVDDYSLPFETHSFDMVMVHAVLDHLHDSPRELMNSLVNFIRPGGYLFVTLPNAVNIRKRLSVLMGETNLPPYQGYYWHPGKWRGHVREYVRNDLRLLAENLELPIIELRGCHHFPKRVKPLVRPIYMALSRVFTGWRDSWTLVAQKPQGWVPRGELSGDELAKVLRTVAS